MKFLEKNLEDIIFDSNNADLRDIGLDCLKGKKIRQLRLGSYGIADIVTFEKPEYIEEGWRDQIPKDLDYVRFFKPTITVYELKKGSIDMDSFCQALRYVKGIQRGIKSRGKSSVFDDCYLKFDDFFPSYGIEYKIVLIGSDISLSNSFCYLPEFCNVELYTYDFKIDGMSFESHMGYKKIEENF